MLFVTWAVVVFFVVTFTAFSMAGLEDTKACIDIEDEKK